MAGARSTARLLRRAACALLASLLAVAGAWAQAPCTDARAVPVAHRTITTADGTVLAAAVPVPDTLPASLRTENHRIRYRLDVGACAGQPMLGLWLFRVGAPFVIHSDDGQSLALLSAGAGLQSERLLRSLMPSGEVVHNGRFPALFALPPNARTVTIELRAIPFIPAGLVRAELGPAQQLLPRQARSVDEVVAFADAAAAVALVLGGLAVLLWLQRREDRALLWLALACGLWGLRGLAYFGPLVFGDPMLFEQFNPLNVLLASVTLALSVLSLLGVMRRRTGRVLAGLTIACFAALVLAHLTGQGAAAARALCLVGSFLIVSSLVVAVVRERAQLRRWHVVIVAGGLLGVLACAVHDLLVVFGVLPPDAPTYVFWGFVTLLIGFAGMSGHYVVQTLNRAERSNEELERRVVRKTYELEQSYARLRETERESARTQERERLLRDMHDGLGAHLMTALRGLERGALGPQQLTQSLQDSLDELRLLMDSTDMGHYLPGALAAWRNRWDRRLAAAGVTLEWQIDESLDEVQLASDAALQVMRILQEAATNIVKHAQARRMVLDARVVHGEEGRNLCILIRDDGVGFGSVVERPGARGMKNMQHRAAQIGAAIAFRDGAQGGTEIVLSLPLDQATRPRRAASMAASAREEIPSLR